MPTTAVSSTTPTTAATASSNVFASMGGDAFLKLLVAQMRYQNPMSPSDPTAMMGQIATYAQVEALNKIESSQASDQMMNAARMATELVGKTVTATDGTTTEVGKVTAARFTADGPVLVLENGTELTLAAVIAVTDTAAEAAAPTTAARSDLLPSLGATTASAAATPTAGATPPTSSVTTTTAPTVAPTSTVTATSPTTTTVTAPPTTTLLG
jgi:flagellar basal-body rod modification protein FlgD